MRFKPPFFKGLVLLVILASVVGTSLAAAASNRPPDDSEIRAGYDIAVTTCVACHVVSPGQGIQPLEGRTISSFQEIANQPNLTLDSLANPTKGCSGSTRRDLHHCSPFDHISDREWRQVAAYILSLRSPL
jgi:mono/diheme cytochrome c family protein